MSGVIDSNKFCLHNSFEVNQDGFTVCRDCGICLGNDWQLKSNPPHFNPNIKENKNIHHEFMNHNQIGNKRELMCNNVKYNRLKGLNDAMDSYEFFKRDLLIEISRLLSALKLPRDLNREMVNKGILFYSQFQKGLRLRSANTIGAVTVYLDCLDHKIVLNRKKFFSLVKIEKRAFNRCLKEVLKNNKDYVNLFRDDNYRKDLVLLQLSGLRETFELSAQFMDKAKKALDKYWTYLKHTKEPIVVGMIYILARKPISDTIVSDFLGIRSSTLSNSFKRFQEKVSI